ncbi:unnamed protein product [Pleuronectes platessa]|uniref:Uncharacterized protein n=1 Tax=Pleuronectes platessa TaxID=8262 RepID=A0A9N7U0Q0_PLEPL|nr:unnamed protein product [Pleuronectes platessa]
MRLVTCSALVTEPKRGSPGQQTGRPPLTGPASLSEGLWVLIEKARREEMIERGRGRGEERRGEERRGEERNRKRKRRGEERRASEPLKIGGQPGRMRGRLVTGGDAALIALSRFHAHFREAAITAQT